MRSVPPAKVVRFCDNVFGGRFELLARHSAVEEVKPVLIIVEILAAESDCIARVKRFPIGRLPRHDLSAADRFGNDAKALTIGGDILKRSLSGFRRGAADFQNIVLIGIPGPRVIAIPVWLSYVLPACSPFGVSQ